MTDEKQTPLLHVSTSPHIRHKESVPSIMLSVAAALVPALAVSIWFFGIKALLLNIVCIVSCLLTEWIIIKLLFKKPSTIGDFSAIVTGLLLAFNLPPDLPLWMAALGSVFAIGVGKMAFGGLGNNFINPALAGRAFLMASYPAAMTTFSETRMGIINGLSQKIDAISSATPLTAIKDAVIAGDFQPLDFQHALRNLFIGNVGGCIGETSVIALLIGAIFLLYKRIIGFSVPVTYIGTVFILFWVFNGATTDLLASDALIIPAYHVLAGGLILGAFFMATDMVTCPITTRGRAIFGIGCGILTFCIRKFGGYPEGVSYSILIMNLFTPLIDRYVRPKMYGKVKKNG
jgi:electron transport complex protein RnfD